MHRLLQLLNALALIAWPLLVWLALTHPQWRGVLVLLALVFAARIWSLRQAQGALNRTLLLLALVGCLLSLASIVLRAQHLLLWYPVVVNGLLLLLFAASLFSPMPLVERLARLREPQLPPRAVRYTRRVTQVWCGFFIFNGSVALTTCLLSHIRLWTLWNGCISYVLMGALMGGEWLLRQRMRKHA
ncbi:hypothetical protein [Pantoea dispersa]|jgi:uncharacterized membrane protein|uniref:COG4648 family protein n=1 Tax=Pantoea dispersa TaxID=59814 RepID=UPI001EC9D6F6|nr:hypothetical protein [Pantoea dispersa]MBZ6390612.1 hypothetical protein [Pantoea dispersa]UYP72088.1 hypothetical protein OF384_12105 [Pantoea dispersa]